MQEVTDGVNQNGTKVQMWECASGNTNQEWLWIIDLMPGGSPLVLQWLNQDKCLVSDLLFQLHASLFVNRIYLMTWRRMVPKSKSGNVRKTAIMNTTRINYGL
jgi:hypothetical protein